MEKKFLTMQFNSCFSDRYGVTDKERLGCFVEQYRKINSLGIEGLVKRAILWDDAQRELTCAEFKEYAALIGLSVESPAYKLMQALADRCSSVRTTHPGDFEYWAMFATMVLFDERKFNRLLEIAGDMGGAFADELLPAFVHESFEQRLDLVSRTKLKTDAGSVNTEESSQNTRFG